MKEVLISWWLFLLDINSAEFKILNEAVCISHFANILGKSINPTIDTLHGRSRNTWRCDLLKNAMCFLKKKSWKQHCTKQQLPFHKPSKMKKTRGSLVQKKGKTCWPNRVNLLISALSLSLYIYIYIYIYIHRCSL